MCGVSFYKETKCMYRLHKCYHISLPSSYILISEGKNGSVRLSLDSVYKVALKLLLNLFIQVSRVTVLIKLSDIKICICMHYVFNILFHIYYSLETYNIIILSLRIELKINYWYFCYSWLYFLIYVFLSFSQCPVSLYL